ncbi:MAG TPA: cytochrome c biogenesis protein ResB [Candidatus Eremiobacteraceae bacterium]|nr:cytochrome c biogenesis protein ResB [Candidatus Eremiobacteraceae bacterium]
MGASIHSVHRKIWQTLGAIKTGVILLILVVILSAAGTVILQRPATDVDEMQRAYSPQVLRLLDGLSLTDVFHAWWFILLLSLVSLSIISASIQRFPNAWRFFSRPYKSPDESFRKALPHHKLIPIQDEEAALSVTDRVLQKAGFRPERIVRENSFSLFGERNRISELAVYIVHASLLLIFLGGIADALFGWRGFVTLTRGQQTSQVDPQKGSRRTLPFAVRCDGAGQENYADGSPKRWWSDLAVLKDGQVIQRKQIVVNDPLVYNGIRFYQASYGRTGKIDRLILNATQRYGQGSKEIAIGLGETLPLDADTTVRLAEFIPDYVVGDGQVYARSNDLENPAAHLVVESKKSGQPLNVWLPPIPGLEQNASSPYSFEGKDIQMAYFTGLEVSHEPGQWAVWAGVVVMGLGLALVFYFVHVRVWAVPVRDARGQLKLWIGGTANKNKDVFEHRFRELVEQVESELKISVQADAEAPVSALAGR